MKFKRTDIIDKSILEKIKQRKEFIEGEKQQGQEQELRPDILNPNPMKLTPMSYKLFKQASNKRLVGWKGYTGSWRADYEVKESIFKTDLSGFHMFENDELPSYIKCRKINASDQPNDYWVYFFKKGRNEPLCLPERVTINLSS